MYCFCGEKASSECANCRHTKYCTVKCQKSDWNEHKKICKLFSNNNYNSEDEILFEFQKYIGTFEPLDSFSEKLNMERKIELFTSALKYWNIKSSLKDINHEMLQVFNCGKDETLLMIQKQFTDFIGLAIIENASKF